MLDTKAGLRELFNRSYLFSKMLHEEQASLCGLIRERWNTFCINRCNYLKSSCYELVCNITPLLSTRSRFWEIWSQCFRMKSMELFYSMRCVLQICSWLPQIFFWSISFPRNKVLKPLPTTKNLESRTLWTFYLMYLSRVMIGGGDICHRPIMVSC